LRGGWDRYRDSQDEQGESAATTGHGNLQISFHWLQAVTHAVTSQQRIDSYRFPVRRRRKTPKIERLRGAADQPDACRRSE
jgi:hypothetical protein